jgi:hypothetical protein
MVSSRTCQYRFGATRSTYSTRFEDLMKRRHIEDTVPRDVISDSSLLCSEDEPAYYHRRPVVEYLKEQWGDTEIRHLGVE